MPFESRYQFLLLVAAAATVALASCQPAAPWRTVSEPVAGSGEQLTITATVRQMSFEGGFFLLAADAGGQYDPVNLPAEFAHDGARVEAVIQQRPELSSFHMAGPLVTVLQIRPGHP